MARKKTGGRTGRSIPKRTAGAELSTAPPGAGPRLYTLEVFLIGGPVTEAFRYYFLRECPFPSDGEFSWTRFAEVYNSELANNLGNLFSREMTLTFKNFGGVFIIWDRLFGTFAEAPKDEKLRFGLVSPLPSQNLLTVNFHEWRKLVRDTWRARGLKARLRVLVGAP